MSAGGFISIALDGRLVKPKLISVLPPNWGTLLCAGQNHVREAWKNTQHGSRVRKGLLRNGYIFHTRFFTGRAVFRFRINLCDRHRPLTLCHVTARNVARQSKPGPLWTRFLRPMDDAKAIRKKSSAKQTTFPQSELCEINGNRMRARWKLGRALAKAERGKPGPKGKDKLTGLTYLKDLLQKLELTKPIALEAQRIGTLPQKELEKEVERAKTEERILYFEYFLTLARPYW